MNTSVRTLIDAYKKHLRKFLATHRLDREYARDIEARIQEKLDALEDPNVENVSALLAEIGTPEEIFRDEIASRQDAPMGLWQRFRDKTGGILFLGVFHTLSEMTHIGANWYRIGFVLLAVMGFLLGSPQIIAGLVFFYGIGFLLLRTGFFRFVFSLLIAFICLALLVPAILIFGMYLSGFHIENIALFSEFPLFFPIGMGLGILSLILFVVFFAAYAFFRHAFGAKFLLVAFITFVTALLCGVATVFHLMATYVTTPKILTYQTSVLPDPEKNTYLVDIDTSVVRDGVHGIPRMEGMIFKGNNQFRLLPSEDEKIHITAVAKIFATTHLAEKMQSYITGISAEVREGWGLTVQVEKDMKNTYPFAPIFMEVIEVKMPINQRFTAKYWDMR